MDNEIGECSDVSYDKSRRKFVELISGATASLVWSRNVEIAGATEEEKEVKEIEIKEILRESSRKALRGGKSGALAAVVQVLTLMWLRTVMNYQYRYGGSLSSALSHLYNEGGVTRLYQGLPFALVQGPLTRFGDTASNMGMLALLDSIPQTEVLPLFVRTGIGSLTAGAFRILLMPVDTSKTVMQVEGREGLNSLWNSILERQSLSPLYRGSLATAAATTVGHYPWFLTYNFFDEFLPPISSKEDLFLYLLRSAFLGLSASSVSDVCSNSLRVIKTTKQTASVTEDKKDISYSEALDLVLKKDGVAGLFGRGLQTRLITNMIQSSFFSILWKYFQSISV